MMSERDAAIIHLHRLKDSHSHNTLSVAACAGDDKCRMLTGLKWDVFMIIFTFLSKFISCHSSKEKLPLEDQFFMTLIKLRHNLTFEMLSTVRGIKKSTSINYFWKWINLLYAKLAFYIKFQDRETIFDIIPPVFKSKFPRLTCIIDCFEIFIDSPKNLKARAQCYSNYKNHTTAKVFISCSPLGHVNFVSNVYGGRASDVQIVRESNFISTKYHLPGDQILADRGFTLHDEFAATCGASLLTPSFTKGKSQLTAQEVEISRNISSVRIHIERIIGLLKNRFTILKGPICIKSIQQITNEIHDDDVASIDKIVKVCAVLLNFGESIVHK